MAAISPIGRVTAMLLALAVDGGATVAEGGGGGARAQSPASPAESAASGTGALYIREFRVNGAKKLPAEAVEEMVYPYFGLGRTADDVEQTRAALEKAYQDSGYQTESMGIPAQEPRGGVGFLQVNENPIGRLRVKGSRYFSLDQIRAGVPSLGEGEGAQFQ